ncbi:MAG: A24 family peptidase [Candidatus Pseudoruminococcus sp.]|uniref:prepilin peptidase n=1 Tax=Candidatus Pseudoruminococcus sp. TaxID=3101048 RepID=UPI002A7A6702|nr:A24 family peptidase [Ruminococcus sp.]MDY2782878.1 A24 family peptidase [Candidatus Pseudoruminococcus sp.]
MIYVVTALCAVVSLLSCILSFVYIDKRKLKDAAEAVTEKKIETSDDNCKMDLSKVNAAENESRIGPFTVIISKLKSLSKKQWIFTVSLVVLTTAELFWSMLCYNLSVTSEIRIAVAAEMLLAATVTDFYVKKIPNKLVLAVYIIRCIIFIPEYFIYGEDFFAVMFSSVIGFVICFVVFFLMSLITKGGIGMGDVKLISAMGCLLGLTGTFYTILFGMIICMFAGIGLILFKKKKMKDKLAFGPFIYFGFLVTIILGTF